MLLKLLESLEKAVALDDPEPPKMMDPGGSFRTDRAFVAGDPLPRIPAENTDPDDDRWADELVSDELAEPEQAKEPALFRHPDPA